MGSIIDKIHENLTEDPNYYDKPKKSQTKMEIDKALFMVNIKYYESLESEHMTHATFQVWSNHATNALRQKDVASFLADNDFVCKISVDMVNSGIFGTNKDESQEDHYV